MNNQQKLNTRIQHKRDTYENWFNTIDFIPLSGEIIIYTTDEYGNKKTNLKVGDGVTNINDLDFVFSS